MRSRRHRRGGGAQAAPQGQGGRRRGGLVVGAAAGRGRRVPTRTCVGCRTSRPKRELVRVVRTPDGNVVLDPTGKIAGRGAYLCADGSCWRTAATRGSVARALDVRLTDELAARLAAGPAMTIEPTPPNQTMTQGGARGQE